LILKVKKLWILAIPIYLISPTLIFPKFVMFMYSLMALIVATACIFTSQRLKDEIARLIAMSVGLVFVIMSLSFSPIPLEILGILILLLRFKLVW
jgi:thiol:disulfide interchange protein